jgi:hypothetical protein
MLEEFLEHPFFLNRHRQAPRLKERESFLSHLQQQGTSRKALRNLSGELLPVMRLLKLTEMRDVSLEEIQRAALCWAREQRTNPKAQSYGNSASFFVYAAKKWLRFHGRLKLPSAPPMRRELSIRRLLSSPSPAPEPCGCDRPFHSNRQ